MVSGKLLITFVLVMSSIVLLAVFDDLLRCLSFFVVRIFLKLLAVFVGRRRSFSLFLLVVFSLFFSAVSEASRYFVGCLFAVISRLGTFGTLKFFSCFCRPSWKLLAVFVSHLGSFLLFSAAVLEASVCRTWFFLVCRYLAALASLSCCFLAFICRSSRCFSSLFFLFFFSKNVFWHCSNRSTR